MNMLEKNIPYKVVDLFLSHLMSNTRIIPLLECCYTKDDKTMISI